MTILGALNCGDYLLIGADSLAMDGEISQTVQKLEYRDNPYMAWWFAGAESLGLLFGDWLRQFQFDDSIDWKQLAEKATAKVGQLNEERLNNATKLEIEPKNIRNELICVLLVGYLGNEPEILEIDDKWSWTLHGKARVAFVGGSIAKAQASGSIATLQMQPSFSLNKKVLQTILTVPAKTNLLCGLPIRMLMVTKDDVSELPIDPDI